MAEPPELSPPVTPEELMTVPARYRELIARYVAQRCLDARRPDAGRFVGKVYADAAASTYAGVMVDLATPLDEDSTVEHAERVFQSLVYAACDPIVTPDPDAPPPLPTRGKSDMPNWCVTCGRPYAESFPCGPAHADVARQIELDSGARPI